MSDALDKLDDLRHLPIFPLPLVMLPNEILPLHIFEDRYRKMLADVLAGGRMFGITMYEPDGPRAVGRPIPGTTGTVAEVRESEMLDDGRSNILTLGIIRYRLIDYVDTDEPYLVGDVTYFRDEPAENVKQLADTVFALFERMARAAFKLGGNRGQPPEIQPTDPESLSFLITAAFNFDNDKKYALLEMTSTPGRLSALKGILDQTVAQMEQSAEIQTAATSNGHSSKKINL